VLGLNFAFSEWRAAGKSAMPHPNIKADPAPVLIAAPNSSIAHMKSLVAPSRQGFGDVYRLRVRRTAIAQ
jgi:hypothetical protein